VLQYFDADPDPSFTWMQYCISGSEFFVDEDPDLFFFFEANPDPARQSNLICDHWSTLQSLHGSIMSFQAFTESVYNPLWLHFEPPKLLNFYYYPDPDLVGSLGSSCGYNRFLSCLGCSSQPSTKYYFPHRTLFHFISPYRQGSCTLVQGPLSLSLWS
jgi:hypothetical protein